MGVSEPVLTLIRPSLPTIKKYGLTVDEWEAIAERQARVCAVCKKLPSSGRLHIDHEHAKGWKKMPPEQRKLYVRGLLCFIDNSRFVGRGVTVQRSLAVADYLTAYEARRPQ